MLDAAYGWLDGVMVKREWAAGPEFSLADRAAAPFLFYADWTHAFWVALRAGRVQYAIWRLHMAKTDTDRIEKKILLRAPRARVWRALTDAGEFGSWFGVKLEGTIEPGARLSGKIMHPDYAHVPFEITIERVEPERWVSWRWHPHAIERGRDYSTEPTTLVAFELEEVTGGTMLKIVESGFDGIPLSRRAEAYRGNEGGWTAQLENIARHVSDAA
jgi:uncharacterized protein YndB with AHSA1/START domain